MKIRFGECEACAVYQTERDSLQSQVEKVNANWSSRVKYLEGQVDLLRREWQNEREEYKRAVDRLLEILNARPVGQGQTEATVKPPININDMMGIFSEVDAGHRE